MKKLFILVLIPFQAFLQNLVNNGSFEEYSICPDAPGQLENAVSWINPVSNIDATPDLFHSCSTVYGVPTCCGGSHYQYAKSGESYAALFTYNDNFANIREYAQNKLLDSLKKDMCYFFSMYINSFNYSSYKTNGMGVFFSDEKIMGGLNDYLLNYSPQIFSEGVINDTLNWIQIYGVYKPSSNNKYITIGNFFDDNSTDTIIVFEDLQRSSIYFLDDISLFQLGEGYAGKDSTILLGSSIFLGQDVENLTSKWSILGGIEIANNVSGVLVSPTETTTYVCEQNFCGEVMYDTITVTVVDDAGFESLSPHGQIKLNPNPNNGTFELQNFSIKPLFFTITNTLGQIVYQDTLFSEKQTIELQVEKGVYFVNSGGFSEKLVVW